MSIDPERLADDSRDPSALADMVRAAQGSVPTPTDAARNRMAAALGLPIVPITVPSAPPPAPIAGGALSTPWIGAIVGSAGVLLAVITYLAWPTNDSHAASPSAEAPAAMEIRPQEVVHDTNIDPVPTVQPVESESESLSVDVEVEETTRAPRVARHERPADLGEMLRAEAAFIARGSRVLADDPSQALRIADQHPRRFPQGILGQEREVLAIDALLRLERRDAAERRANAFEARYPNSVHAERIHRLLAAGRRSADVESGLDVPEQPRLP